MRNRRLAILMLGATAAVAGVMATAVGAQKSEPGGSLVAAGTLQDNQGASIEFVLEATEASTQAGIGDMFLQLSGPAITACDVHGPPAVPGNAVMAGTVCGGSSGVSVVVDGCHAVLETHGVVHTDHPWTVYLGPNTTDLRFTYNPDKAEGEMRVEIHTPKEPIVLQGKTTGTVVMPTCT